MSPCSDAGVWSRLSVNKIGMRAHLRRKPAHGENAMSEHDMSHSLISRTRCGTECRAVT